MAQYPLTPYQPDGPPPPEYLARLPQILKAADAVIKEIDDAGVWVNGGTQSRGGARVGSQDRPRSPSRSRFVRSRSSSWPPTEPREPSFLRARS